MAWLASLILLLLPAVAADPEASFTFPTEKGLKFSAGDTIDVGWKSNIRYASLWLFCMGNDEIKLGSYMTRNSSPRVSD